MSPRFKPYLSFSLKILLPVLLLITMVILVSSFAVNRKVTKEIGRQAEKSLYASEKVFREFHEFAHHNLKSQCKALVNDSRFKSLVHLNNASALDSYFANMLIEWEEDFIVYYNPETDRYIETSRKTSSTNQSDKTHFKQAVMQILDHQTDHGCMALKDGIIDYSKLPVKSLLTPNGSVTIGKYLTAHDAAASSELTDTDILFYAGDQLVCSTLRQPEVADQVQEMIGAAVGGASENVLFGEVQPLKGRPYLSLAGRLDSEKNSIPVRFVMLASTNAHLQMLGENRQMMLWIGALSLIFGGALIWVLIKRLTRPLNQLRTSVEAVGRGEFDREVRVHSFDEFGELAVAFNQMTDNLHLSRSNLEKTVAKLKETRERLAQSEKLSAIGEFIAGVAHELNNPLTILVGYAQILEESDMEAKYKKDLRQITCSASRCRKVVEGLLSFARQGKLERNSVSINELIQGTINFMDYEMRTSNVIVSSDLDANLPSVEADPHQMQQIFLNIMNNARQAIMESGRHGELKIQTLASADRVRISIEDNGPGMPESVRSKIFDPFFTTKEEGMGTGLGLSVSYGIVQEHGGEIMVESEVACGTKFIIDLPAITQAVPAPAVEQAAPERPVQSVALGVGKSVLVVDDEASIVNMVSAILRSNGFDVETAVEGGSALEQIRARAFDMIFCDWKMPGISGSELYEQVCNEMPELSGRFIFMSGDVLNGDVQAVIDQNGSHYLPKPFSLDDFRSLIHAVA